MVRQPLVDVRERSSVARSRAAGAVALSMIAWCSTRPSAAMPLRDRGGWTMPGCGRGFTSTSAEPPSVHDVEPMHPSVKVRLRAARLREAKT